MVATFVCTFRGTSLECPPRCVSLSGTRLTTVICVRFTTVYGVRGFTGCKSLGIERKSTKSKKGQNVNVSKNMLMTDMSIKRARCVAFALSHISTQLQFAPRAPLGPCGHAMRAISVVARAIRRSCRLVGRCPLSRFSAGSTSVPTPHLFARARGASPPHTCTPSYVWHRLLHLTSAQRMNGKRHSSGPQHAHGFGLVHSFSPG